MNCKILRKDTVLQVQFKIDNKSNLTYESEEIIFNDILKFRAQHITNENNDEYENTVLIKINMASTKNECMYRLKLTCPELEIKETFLYPDELWRVINKNFEVNPYTFTITIQSEPIIFTKFSSLYEDEQLTDFKLRTHDGEVGIHKAFLAAASKKFKEDLVKKNENFILLDIPDVSVKTLQDFKKFIYTEVLPDNNLEELLLVASYFKINFLEYKCVEKMIVTIKTKTSNAIKSLEFALEHKHMLLFLGIMDCVQNGEIKIGEVREYYLNSNNTI